MQLKDLAKPATLKLVTIDDEEIIKKYGETLEFYTYDSIPYHEYMEVMAVVRDNPEDPDILYQFAAKYMLDEKGKPFLPASKVKKLNSDGTKKTKAQIKKEEAEQHRIHPNVCTLAIHKVWETLMGNL